MNENYFNSPEQGPAPGESGPIGPDTYTSPGQIYEEQNVYNQNGSPQGNGYQSTPNGTYGQTATTGYSYDQNGYGPGGYGTNTYGTNGNTMYGYGPYTYPPIPSVPSTDGAGIACLVLGILGFLSGIFFVGLLLDVLAIIFGIVSLSQRIHRKGMAVSGIIVAVLSILLTAAIYGIAIYTANTAVSEISRISGYDYDSYDYDDYDYSYYNEESKISSDVLLSSITTLEYPTSKGIIIICTNENDVPVDITADITYYDSNHNMISLSDEYGFDCPPGRKTVFYANPPYDKDYNTLSYADYSLDLDVSASNSGYDLETYLNSITIESNQAASGGVIASLSNTSGTMFDSVLAGCLYYKDGQVVDYVTEYADNLSGNKKIEFYPPSDSDYDSIPYDDYEVFVSTVYIYNE